MSGNRFADGAIGAGALIGSFFFPPAAVGLASLFKTTGASLLLQSLVGPGKRTDLSGRQEGIETNVSSPQRTLPVVYGQARLGIAPVDYRTVAPANTLLYIVGALCAGSSDGAGIQSIDAVYFNDVMAFNAGGTKVSPYDSATILLGKYLGTDSQTVSPGMNTNFPTQWPASSQGKGIAYIALALQYDGQLFPNIPTITADVHGVHLYDPRTATWNTAPGDDVNPALAIYDYLTSTRYGMGIAASELDTQSFIDMANYYDETVTSFSSGTQPRFRCRGWLDTAATFAENLTFLLNTCRGTLLYDNGLIRLFTRRATASVSYALDETQIIGDWSFTTPGVASAPTAMEATFTDPARRDRPQTTRWPREQTLGVQNAYLVAPAKIQLLLTGDPASGWEHGLATGDQITVAGVAGLTGANGTWTVTRIDSATVELNGSSGSGTWTAGSGTVRAINPYTAADGGFETLQRIDLPMTSNRLQAEHIINVMVRELRSGLSAEVTCRQSALQLRVGDVVNVTHPTPGWVAKAFWVMAVTLLPDDTVRLNLNEYDATAYTLAPSATAPGVPSTNMPNPLICLPPSTLLLSNGTQRGDQSVAQLLASWTESPDPFVDHYLIQARRYVPGGTGAWDDFGTTPREVTSFVVSPLTPNEAWEVRIFAVNTLGRRSDPISNFWTAVLNPATIALGTAVRNSTYIEIPYTIPYDSTATIVEVWYREDDSAPSLGSIVRGYGAQPAGTPIVKPVVAVGAVYSGSVTLRCSPSSYVTVLFVPIDTNNRPNLTIPVQQVQALAAPATPPTAPTSTTFITASASSVSMGVVMPASIPSGAVIRTYRNGVVYGSDVAITVAGSATQTIVYTGLSPATSFSWQHALVNANGTSSLTSAVAGNTSTGTIPTPTLAVTDARLDATTQSFNALATAGAGSPPGMTWEYERDDGGGYVNVGSTVNSTLEIFFARAASAYTGYIRIRATLTGYTTSAYSTPVAVTVLSLGGGTDP